MKLLLVEINNIIHPSQVHKHLLNNIIQDLLNKIHICYKHDLSDIKNPEYKDARIKEIISTHCKNRTQTTKRAIKKTLQKFLSTSQYQKFGLKLLYAILDAGIGPQSNQILSQELSIMTVDPKLEAIALKVMNKMNLNNENNNNHSSIILIVMIIGVVLSLIRILQECNSSRLLGLNKEQKKKFMYDQVSSICIAKTFINKWRLKKIIKEKLSNEDYKLYGLKLRDAIMEAGTELTEEENLTLMEAANV